MTLKAVNEYIVVKKIVKETNESIFSKDKTEGLIFAEIYITNDNYDYKEKDKVYVSPIGVVNITLEGEEVLLINSNTIVLVCQ